MIQMHTLLAEEYAVIRIEYSAEVWSWRRNNIVRPQNPSAALLFRFDILYVTNGKFLSASIPPIKKAKAVPIIFQVQCVHSCLSLDRMEKVHPPSS